MSLTDTPNPQPAAAPDDVPRRLGRTISPADRRFRTIATVGGYSTLVIMVLIAGFLLLRGWDAFSAVGWSFFTTTEWKPQADPPVFGVAAMLYGTLVVAFIALLVAVPVALATALFINEFAPLRIKRLLTSLVDLLAAIPSIIYGIWGFFFLQPALFGTIDWITTYLGWIPFLASDQEIFQGSLFMSGLVVALMVLPITSSVMREVFSQAPPLEREGALALGSTRWGMIRTVVLPFGRGGIVGGSMLGLGRALGETIAVAIILSTSYEIQKLILEPGGATVAGSIAVEFGEATPFGVSALMAAGLALFGLTLVVNMGANAIVKRSRSGAGVEL